MCLVQVVVQELAEFTLSDQVVDRVTLINFQDMDQFVYSRLYDVLSCLFKKLRK